MHEKMRLSKLMSERGICSRREADEYIRQGWVIVDGKVVNELGTKVSPDAVVELVYEARNDQAEKVAVVLNKPVGYVSAQPEKGYRPAIVLIVSENQWAKDVRRTFSLEKLAVAGRLDIDSTGLLLFTQDGRVAKALVGQNSQVEKEYLVRVAGELDERGLALLRHGLELDGKPLKPAKVEWVNESQLRFVLKEGRKRQIRRMCQAVGIEVGGLKRVRIGPVRLGGLKEGEWRFLTRKEYADLLS
ncbi:rRNA pseudouridine synthase [Simkania negevensis]|uniref:rRNA pseudouridine synthase n=1 Tax=Simkania negevensis TaxID=83561 RepID=A0ABS3ARQ1_9BACT|nr:rRNA pseudouridine synthase [Simkania negevensis]